MDLNQIRNIITNFIQRDWVPEQLTSELNYAQLRYFPIAVKMEKDLHQFKVKKGEGTPPLYVTGGVATIPSDYQEFISMNVPSGGSNYRVRKCDSELFDYLRESPIEFPTSAYPICRFTGTQIQFLPADILYVNFVYYKKPPIPVYGYTTSHGFLEYNASTSTQLDWDEQDQIAIIQIMLQDLGVIATAEQIRQKQNDSKRNTNAM